MANTTYNRFHLNFADKTIVGTKASFAKAGKGFGPIYDELTALMARHPDFTVNVKAPTQPPKPRQTYKGMDIPFIRDFLMAVDDAITLKAVNNTIAYAIKEGIPQYPLVKRTFFETYDEFDFVDAKKIVADYRYQQMREKADELAAKRAALVA